MDIVTLIITNVPYQSKNVSTRGNYRAYGNALFYLHIFSINQKYSWIEIENLTLGLMLQLHFP